VADRAAQRGEEMIGRTLREKWRVDALLGQGGMATVYAATHRNGMRGAIKLLHPHLSDSDDLRARLVREGYVANRVKHPGVVRILDDDVTEEGQAFIVMELLEGEAWKSRWLKAGRSLPVASVLDVTAKVLDILRVAHAAGVVHRDVKPDNVFITSEEEVKLLDFGIARLREGNMEATQTGAMLGTPAFMSPEQALAQWNKVDARSDLFSVGATMWVLSTGAMLHTCSTVPELLVAAATRQAAPFADVFPEATPELAEVVDRAVAFEPDARWPSAEAMLEALERARASLAESPTRRVVAASSAPSAAQSTIRMAPAASSAKVAPVAEAVGVAPATRLPRAASVDRVEPLEVSTSHSMAADQVSRADAKPNESTDTSSATRPGRAGFGAGLAAGGGVAVALAAAFGVYFYATRSPSAPISAASGSPITTETGAPEPSASVIVPEDRSSRPIAEISAAPSADAPESSAFPRRTTAPVRPTTIRKFSPDEARTALAQAAERAAYSCKFAVTAPLGLVVTGTFLPDGSFSNVAISPGEQQFSQAGSCVVSTMQVHVSSFAGPAQPGSVAVNLVPR